LDNQSPLDVTELFTTILKELKLQNNNNVVSFGKLDVGYVLCVLTGAYLPILNSGKHITFSMYDGLIHSALVDTFKKGKLSPSNFKTELKNQIKLYEKKEFQNFTVISPILCSSIMFGAKSVWGKARISILKGLPLKYNFEKAFSNFKHDYDYDLPNDYGFVTIHLQAKSIAEAFESAFNKLDFIRGIWNLFVNLHVPMRISTGKNQHVNKIVLGPIGTIHNLNGSLASEWSYWSNDDGYLPPSALSIDAVKWDKIRKFEKSTRNKISVLFNKERVINSIVRYCRALDCNNLQETFIQLWALLEYLTYTDFDRYDITIRRICSLYSDTDSTIAILELFRNIRNSWVHSGVTSNNNERHVYLLKRFVEHILLFYINRSHFIRNQNELTQFLDLPFDSEDIHTKIRIQKNCLKYRKK
jgi:hypothetical protein